MLVPPLLRPLTSAQTHFCALGLTLSYVGGIYFSNFLFRKETSQRLPRTRPANSSGDSISQTIVEEEPTLQPQSRRGTVNRNDPDVIVRRLGAAVIVTIAGLAAVRRLVARTFEISELPSYALRTAASYIGLPTSFPRPSDFLAPPPSFLFSTLSPYFLAPLLFLGPLYCLHLDQELPGQSHGKGWAIFDWARSFGPYGDGQNGLGVRRGEEEVERVRIEGLRRERLMALRDYVVGPITEELAFRSCIIAVYKLGNAGWKTLVFGTPIWFGIAHAHHAYGRWRENGSTAKAAVQAIAVAAFQLTYTTLFGWYAAWLFVKTGSIFPSIASHIFANSMGLPAPQGTIRAFPEKRSSIIAAYLAGIATFAIGIRGVQDGHF